MLKQNWRLASREPTCYPDREGLEFWFFPATAKRQSSLRYGKGMEAEVETTCVLHSIFREDPSRNTDILTVSIVQSQENHGTLNNPRILRYIISVINSDQENSLETILREKYWSLWPSKVETGGKVQTWFGGRNSNGQRRKPELE